MTPDELKKKLSELLALPMETEWVEFKHNNANPEEIGEYLSAISNSVVLHRKNKGYIVWGIENNSHKVLGTTFRPHQKKVGNEELENWLLKLSNPRIEFSIYELQYQSRPVVLFEIDSTRSHPCQFRGNEYIRIGTYKKKLKDFPEKARRLWQILSEQKQDWSSKICEAATIKDLDSDAVLFAREQYRKKLEGNIEKTHLLEELKQWDDVTFLNKIKVCVNTQITTAAILLLGKSESEHFLSPALAQITWMLKVESGLEKDYEHFGLPLILAVNKIYAKVRNLTYRYMENASLFPMEVTQYDPWVIRETLHNCIAHQDYTKNGRINLVEEPESLLFTNLGHFLPGSLENVLLRDAPPDQYRNPFLAHAMVNLNMIDTIGSGIKRMFTVQRQRFFPMPDYELDDPERVRVRLIGKILDENYTRMLIKNTDLPLLDVIALDKVQKKYPLSNKAFKSLKTAKLIEGRRPNLFVSARVAAATGNKVTYIKLRGLEKEHYKKLICSYLIKFGEGSREALDSLLMNKISDALNEDQKKNVVTNLLQEMRKEKIIYSHGTTRWAKWRIYKPKQ